MVKKTAKQVEGEKISQSVSIEVFNSLVKANMILAETHKILAENQLRLVNLLYSQTMKESKYSKVCMNCDHFYTCPIAGRDHSFKIGLCKRYENHHSEKLLPISELNEFLKRHHN